MVYALFLVFFLANLLMLPLGWLAIKFARRLLSVPREVLMPIILIFCIVGAYAIENNIFNVWVMLGMGVIGYLFEENGVPTAPAILGVVLGKMIEENFMQSMIKAGKHRWAFRAPDRRNDWRAHPDPLGGPNRLAYMA